MTKKIHIIVHDNLSEQQKEEFSKQILILIQKPFDARRFNLLGILTIDATADQIKKIKKMTDFVASIQEDGEKHLIN